MSRRRLVTHTHKQTRHVKLFALIVHIHIRKAQASSDFVRVGVHVCVPVLLGHAGKSLI